MATFDGFEVTSGVLSEAECKAAAVNGRLREVFGANEDGTFTPDLERVRSWTIALVRRLAAEREDALDALVSGNPVRFVMLNTEIVDYANAGRPADPAANRYVIANALAARRGITLRAMLETLLGRWRDVQQQVATLITQLDAATEAIEAAQTVADIEAVLAGLPLH